MHFEYGNASVEVRIIHRHLPVKASRTHQCRIQDVFSVGCRHDDDPLIDSKPIHFDKELVERLLPFVMSSAQACTASAADCINFINKDNRRSNTLRLIKQVTHTARADADIHFHKVGS